MAAPTYSTAQAEHFHDPTSFQIVPDENPHSGDEPDFVTDPDNASSTQSLSSSVVNYQYENGRRYHAYREGEYLIPNDDREQERLQLHHHICTLALGGGLFCSPVDLSSAEVLDLGTGTGVWAIEVAEKAASLFFFEYPGASVTGTDLSPIQPRWVSFNCFFEVKDFESQWEFTKPFDFIHCRNLGGSVRDFHVLFERIFNNLNLGGWVEMADFEPGFWSDDNTIQNAPYLKEWARLQVETAYRFGKRLDATRSLKQWMIDAGFQNVTEELYKIPLNPWPKDPHYKELGRYHQLNMIEALQSYSLAGFTRVLEWPAEEVQAFLAEVRKEIMDRKLHIYTKFYWVYGQKPE